LDERLFYPQAAIGMMVKERFGKSTVGLLLASFWRIVSQFQTNIFQIVSHERERTQMATYTFFYKIRVDLQKFSSGHALLDKWHQEAQAAKGAINAGVVQVWKDTADAVVYVIIKMEADDAAQAHGEVLNIFASLPMGASGELIIEEARSVISYLEWAQYLERRGS
jgi:hypothetical protein